MVTLLTPPVRGLPTSEPPKSIYSLPSVVRAGYRAVALTIPNLEAYWSLSDQSSPLHPMFGTSGDMTVLGGTPNYAVAGATPSDGNRAWDSAGSGYAKCAGIGTIPIGAAPRTFVLFAAGTSGAMFGYGSAGTRQIFVPTFNGANSLIVATYNDNPSMTANTFGDGTWHHVAVTYDGNVTIQAYIDGTVQGSATLGGPLNTIGSNFGIGRDTAQNAFQTNGKFQELGAWSRVLTLTEIRRLFAAR